MTIDPATMLAILAMGAATFATRLAGLIMVHYIPVSGRTRAALEAVPAAVLMAVIAPMVVATGIAETIAAVVTALAALRLPLIAVVAIGIAAVIALRALIS
jgi:branched chain amino acid efflux pump